MPTAVALIPPFEPTAEQELTSYRCFIGGPRAFVAAATIAEGQALTLPADTTLLTTFTVGQDTTITLTDGSAFLDGQGAIYVPVLHVNAGAPVSTGTLTDNWLTYDGRAGDLLIGVKQVSGDDTVLPLGSSVSQWREITDDLIRIRRGWSQNGVAFTHFCEIEGVTWASLVEYEDASLYVEARYWNSTYQEWTPYVPVFLGYFDPPRPSADADGSTWRVTARCESKYLTQQPAIPKQYGANMLAGTATASSTLGDPTAEPAEWNGYATFDAANVLDGDRSTLWCSLGVPTTAAPLADYPAGPMAVGPGDIANFGVKIMQMGIAFVPGIKRSLQDFQWIEIVNMGPDPKGPPYEDGIDTKRITDPKDPGYGDGNQYRTTVTPAAADASTALAVDLAGFTLENEKGVRVSLGTKNGGATGQIPLARYHSAILCYDKTVFDTIMRPPADTLVIEWKQCDGFRPIADKGAQDPAISAHGVGRDLVFDPAGGYLALRESSGQASTIRFGQLTGTYAPSPELAPAAGGDTIAANGQLRCTTSIPAGFTPRGYLIAGESEIRVSYTSYSGDTFSGCRKVNHNKNGDDQPGQHEIRPDQGLRQGVFGDNIRDFVAWGNVSTPAYFYKFVDDADPVDQNWEGVEAHRVWGWRGADGYSSGWDRNTRVNVAPNGIPYGSSIRRKNAMGGGVMQGDRNDDGTGLFSKHDGGTAMDWELTTTPRIGNAGAATTLEWLRIKITPTAGAIVAVDDTATVDAAGVAIREISVQAGGGYNFPGQLVWPNRMRSSTGVEFVYSHRDASTFYGVIKLHTDGDPYPYGQGPTIGAGATLASVIDTNPPHYAAQGIPPRLAPMNLPAIVAFDMQRWSDSFNGTVAADFDGHAADTHKIDGRLTLMAGQGASFPTSGGADMNLAGGVHITWTGRDGDTLIGVVCNPEIRLPAFPAGWILVNTTAVSFPSNFIILATRRPDPGDPLTYLGNDGPDWWPILRSTAGARLDSVPFVFADLNPFISEFIIIYQKMSDGGRAKCNTINLYGYPNRDFTDAASASQDALRLGYSAADIIDEILADAGYPPERRNCYGGQFERSVRVSSGSVWAAITQLCQDDGLIVEDGPLGTIRVRPNAQRPGAYYPATPRVTLGPDAIRGTITLEFKPRHQAGQVNLHAVNSVLQEHFSVTIPPTPYPLGGLVTIDSRRAASLKDAEDQARLELLIANGGFQFKISTGHTDDYGAQEIIRVDAPMDANGQWYDGPAMVTGLEAIGDADGQVCNVTAVGLRTL